ncbi:MAG: DUF374 domain-containing protein [Pseudomonadota bacterium]|nr:DUF374 domain-containing protein [Pseudomonadota bacterium]
MSRPNLLKRLLRQDWLRNAGASLLGVYLKFVGLTSRFTLIGLDDFKNFTSKRETFCIALWHNRLSLMPMMRPHMPRQLSIIISGHRDGRMVGKVFETYGIEAIPARSGTNDMDAARAIVKASRQGHFIGITPDGPRGPRMRMKPFAVDVGRLCKSPVTLITGSPKRRIMFNSWDRFILPLPFNHIVLIWEEGPPVPDSFDSASAERYRQELENTLTRMTNKADSLVGQPVIAPDERDWSQGPERDARKSA